VAKGGARPGAGRKRTRVLYASPIREAESKIRDRLPWLADKMLELAEGVYAESEMGESGRIVYKQIPDRQAIAYLMDRIMGKPTQPVDIIQSVRDLARQAGMAEDVAVAEAERYLMELRGGARS
jgi:hypothetical protein